MTWRETNKRSPNHSSDSTNTYCGNSVEEKSGYHAPVAWKYDFKHQKKIMDYRCLRDKVGSNINLLQMYNIQACLNIMLNLVY